MKSFKNLERVHMALYGKLSIVN